MFRLLAPDRRAGRRIYGTSQAAKSHVKSQKGPPNNTLLYDSVTNTDAREIRASKKHENAC